MNNILDYKGYRLFQSSYDDSKEIVMNTPPVASSINVSTQTETAISAQLPAVDLDGDTLTFAAVVEPMLGSLTVNTDGTYVYTPNAEVTGSDSFTFSVTDGLEQPVTGTINITIEALTVSFLASSRNAFGQAPTDTPLSVNGRVFTQDVVNQSDYQDLIDAN